MYVEDDTIPEAKAVGDVKTAAVDAVTFSGFVGGESATTEVVAAVAGVAAVAEVLYVEGDTIPDGKAVGDVKTAAVSAVAAVAAVPNVVTAGLVVSYDKPVSNGGVYVATPAGLSSKQLRIHLYCRVTGSDQIKCSDYTDQYISGLHRFRPWRYGNPFD